MKHAILPGALLGLVTLFAPMPVYASEEGPELKQPNISQDRATLRKGVEVFTETCMGCHSAKYMTYHDLIVYPEIGLSRKAVDALRGENSLLSGLITELSPKDANVSFGTVPPDLSLITRSREGPDYVYSILTGFAHDPDGRIPDGHYNIYFPSHNIAMPDPLSWLGHDKEDEADLKEQARAVASFLAFIAEPHQIQRKKIGLWVMIFLVLFTIVLYALKREVWKDIKH